MVTIVLELVVKLSVSIICSFSTELVTHQLSHAVTFLTQTRHFQETFNQMWKKKHMKNSET